MTSGTPHDGPPKVAVVLVNWNNYPDTRACLLSLGRLSYPPAAVLVVDNGSTDGSLERLKAEFSHLDFIANRENLGFARGCNIGIRLALARGCDYLLLLNNDTEVDGGCLDSLVRAGEADPRVGVVTGKIMISLDPPVLQAAGYGIDFLRAQGIPHGAGERDNGQWDRERDVPAASGCFMLVKRRVFEKIGLLDEAFFFGMEDYEFAVRVRRGGYRIRYVPGARLWHKDGRSERRVDSAARLENGIISRVALMRKITPRPLWLLWHGAFFLYAHTFLPLSRVRLVRGLAPEEIRRVVGRVYRGEPTSGVWRSADDINQSL